MPVQGIAIIGRIAENTSLTDGQTMKTRVLYDELRRRFPERDFVCVDTYQYRRHPFSILCQTVRAFFRCGHVFILLSRNGRKFFFPVLNCLNKLFHRRLYHDVVGGALPREAAKSHTLRRQLKHFTVNWVETPQMKEELNHLGIHNVEVLPNFKRLNCLRPDQIPELVSAPFTFTIFSRIVKEKGIAEAAEAICNANRHFRKKIAQLHIYGPVAPEYAKEFHEILSRHKDYVAYLGCIPSDQSVSVLKDSFMLLFPSVYPGEGLPGTIIDAFSAALPVICTDWRFNSDLVKHKKTGYCYNWKDASLLTYYVIYALEHPQEVQEMRISCLKESSKYTPEMPIRQICKKMEEL